MNQAKFSLDGHSLITPEAIASEFHANRNPASASTMIGRSNLTLVLELALQLDLARQQLAKATDVAATVHRIVHLLHDVRGRVDENVWLELVPFIQNHPLAAYLLEDPITRWSFDKPRGYSGDAHLLDLIYDHPTVQDQIAAASALGREIFAYTSTAPSSMANRDRRAILARFADEAAGTFGPETEILSIAAGHLREVEVSDAWKRRAMKRWVALDQDPISVATILRDYQGTGVETIHGSVRDIIARKVQPGRFDLVYASGLYDYLADKVAIKLTERCLDMVRPGGTYLFANYSHPIVVDGYLETFMNWALLLRSEQDMWNIIHAATGGSDAYESDVFFGENRKLVYGVIRKRG